MRWRHQIFSALYLKETANSGPKDRPANPHMRDHYFRGSSALHPSLNTLPVFYHRRGGDSAPAVDLSIKIAGRQQQQQRKTLARLTVARRSRSLIPSRAHHTRFFPPTLSLSLWRRKIGAVTSIKIHVHSARGWRIPCSSRKRPNRLIGCERLRAYIHMIAPSSRCCLALSQCRILMRTSEPACTYLSLFFFCNSGSFGKLRR